MKNLTLLILIMGTFVLSCSPSGTKKTIGFEEEEKIFLQEINYPDLLGYVTDLIKIDNLLLINDFYGDSLIQVFDLEEEKILTSLIRSGEGPHELLTPLFLQVLNKDLYIFSKPIYSLNYISLDKLKNESVPLIHTCTLPSQTVNFVPLSSELFVLSGYWNNRYALFNLSEGWTKEFGSYPDYAPHEQDIPVDAKSMFHQCSFLKHPTENIFLSVSSHVMEKYSFTPDGSTLPVLVERKQLGDYSYEFESGNLVWVNLKEGSDPGVRRAAVDKQYIYLLSYDKEKEYTYIKIYDWEFNPVKLLGCEVKINCLVIDSVEKKGYCIGENPDDTLYRFDINF